MTANLETELMDAKTMMTPVVHIVMPKRMSEKAFFEVCIANPDLRIERVRDGNITAMSPASLISSLQEGGIGVCRQLEVTDRLGNMSFPFHQQRLQHCKSGFHGLHFACLLRNDGLLLLSGDPCGA